MEDQLYTSICSKTTLQSDKKGFFQSYADNVIELAGSQWLDEFKQLTSDSDRLLKCYNDEKLYEAIHGVLQNVQEVYRGKSARLSQLRRMEGEKAASRGKLQQALILLTQAVIRAPGPGVDSSVDDGSSLSLALRARALGLRQLTEYKLCLVDIQLCLKEKLPDKFRVEMYWLMSECYQKLNESARAKVALQVTLKFLGPEDTIWREKLEQELVRLAIVKEQTLSEPEKDEDPERLLDGPHPQLPGVSAAVTVRSAPSAGRFAVARQAISSGDVLTIEPPYTACLLTDKFGSHCHHCMARLRSAVACKHCSALAFCSPTCRDNAHSYHQYECHYMDLMIGSGMSVLCYIALRTVTQQSYSYWQRVCSKQQVSPDYNRIAMLVTHAERREPREFLSRTLMALFLLRILQHSQYIPPTECKDNDKLDGMSLFLACTLLHLLQCLQFNAHEIYDTVYKTEKDVTSRKINYIGVGIYPSASLFNHDCYPAVTRYYRGKELIVRAVRPLKPGDMVGENYGPLFTLRTKSERQRTLTSRYWFCCNCTACQHDWPKLVDMDEDIFNVKCQNKDCGGFITTSTKPKKAKAKCPSCGVNINIAEAVLLIKSYDEDYKQGLALMGEGKLSDASKILAAFSDVMHVVCQPPVKNICLAHEALRSCWAYRYNKHVLNK